MIKHIFFFNREGESDGLKDERDEIKNHFDEKKSKYVKEEEDIFTIC